MGPWGRGAVLIIVVSQLDTRTSTYRKISIYCSWENDSWLCKIANASNAMQSSTLCKMPTIFNRELYYGILGINCIYSTPFYWIITYFGKKPMILYNFCELFNHIKVLLLKSWKKILIIYIIQWMYRKLAWKSISELWFRNHTNLK